jgi:hypothetical protein
MNKVKGLISARCRIRLHVQGYDKYTDNELYDFKYGIRFAYAGCVTLVASGLYLQNLPILVIAAVVAFAGAFPPYHPFDYLYNYTVRHFIKKPKMPPRTNQGRFACGIGSLWLTATIYFLMSANLVMFYTLGILLLMVGALVTFVDICIPSMVYNSWFRKRGLTSN